jgi:YihY family inner membrane protein
MIEKFRHACVPTFRYWMETEVHVYAFSIAANVLLSFFPFLIVMVSICRNILRWPAAEQAILSSIMDFFPGTVGEFVTRNLLATLYTSGPVNVVSLFLLFFTANGIFEPLEVALNRAWRVGTNRSWIRNQLISLLLIFAVGALVLASAWLTGNSGSWSRLLFRLLAVPLTILVLFLIYWLLPNRKMPVRLILPVSVGVGLALELLKYINLLTLPWLFAKLEHEYGPFKNSVAIVMWSFLVSMIVLAGAEWAARRELISLEEPEPTPPSSLLRL